MSLAKNIRLFRKQKGLTQAELAKAVGCHKQYLSELERGKYDNPAIKLVRAIADALDVKIDELTLDE